ncbi:CheY chemotaxis protein or a CheY-like REC (receiver) domain [Pustulibacterium marinum]|uniref:CheY chemotaxis protein or a CheY-like REC (Receiver) domain n=1 Tax=Pustulibacterium marinum TaxID=1224947 RepID=A0A1I7HUQ5_9FLAO|nr:response regulator [Pustulibacterium marinum]SFU64397.1 CheY chemotaxis protein or a CheY-like REC (receiver) domain [Pustulibacterium marinum]
MTETTICIIDDDKIYQSLTKKMLLRFHENSNILQFMNGKEALEYFRSKIYQNEHLPRIVLLDINMPVMDGWEFLGKLEELETDFKSIKIHIVSSSIAIADMEKAKGNHNIASYITKPIRLDIIKNLFS